MRKFLERTLCFMAALVLAICSSATSFALTEEQKMMYAQNNIFFYDPGACTEVGLGAFSGETSEGLSNVQASFVDEYYPIAATFAIEYGIPWEAAMAQAMIASSSGTSKLAIEKNDFFGLTMAGSDSNEGSFETPEDGWRAYFEKIKQEPKYRANGVFVGQSITDPYIYIQIIGNSGYSTNSNYTNRAIKLIEAILTRVKKNNEENASEAVDEERLEMMTSKELALEYPEMIENATTNAEMSTEESGATSSESSTSSSKPKTVICNGYGGSGMLVSGGMTLEEAKAFMEPYRSIRPRTYEAGGREILSQWSINNVCNGAPDCCVSDLENCVAFVQYFICEYANVCMGLGHGITVVDTLVGSGKGFIRGDQPQPYAVFSTGGYEGYGHTGVVLGVDEENGKIIIGEAGCFSDINFTNAKVENLSKYTSGRYWYAYTDALIGF